MYISKTPKYRQRPDGTIERVDCYRLSENWRDADGKVRKRTVVGLGELTGYTKAGRKELGLLLQEMVSSGSCRMCEDSRIYDDAVKFYAHWRDLHPKSASSGPVPDSSLGQALESHRRDVVTICLDKVTNHEARTVGAEAVCRSTASRLRLTGFLLENGFDRQEAELAVMQIIARAIYPYSEYRTAKCLRDNTALAEMFHIPKEKLTKDALYKSALRLWDIHRKMEDWLHERVTSMFHIEEKILLVDITNIYMEGRMSGSGLCFHGRSKEKRSECKIVVLAAVVNTEGLIVRTMTYEGNRHDVTTLQEVVGTLASTTSPDARKTVVMDAGFYSDANAKWLVDNHFDYITVLPSGYARFTADSDRVVRHEDCRHQEIRLQMGKVEIEGVQHKALLVDSDAKSLKVQSMHEQSCKRYEEGLEGIKAHLNLAVLAYWIVSVTMYRLKKKGYPHVRWEEIRRIASAQVMVTTRMRTVKGEVIELRQATEEEQELARIYDLLDISPHPMGTRKFVGPPKIPPEKTATENQLVRWITAAMWVMP